jgi:pectinesterase
MKLWSNLLAGLIVISITESSIFAVENSDIIVSKDGSGNFKTIQDAINSVPSNNIKNITILVKNGIYQEHIAIDKSFISIIGESKENTIIRFSIERETWAQQNGNSTVGCAVVNIGCTAAFKKVSGTITNIVIGNLTVENTYSNTGVKTMAVKDEGNCNKVYVVNCNVWSQGHDTISLWNKSAGMYYHADCTFKGALDYVCPRGWCYIVNSTFNNTGSSAPLWHEVAAGTTQKFTVRNGKFNSDNGYTGNFKLMNANNSSGLGTRFILLDCIFSRNCNSEGTFTESYFYNCHGGSGDTSWFANNLTKLASGLTQGQVTAKWTFDNKWDPESEMPSVLPMSTVPQPWTGAYDLNANGLQLKWIKGRNAEVNVIHFGTSSNPPVVKTQTETTYSPSGLSKGTYYWSVDAVSRTDTVKGPVWSFTVAQGVGVLEMNSKNGYNQQFIFRQNVQGNLEITFFSKCVKQTMFTMYTLQGKRVYSQRLIDENSGTIRHLININKLGLPKGRYIGQVQKKKI